MRTPAVEAVDLTFSYRDGRRALGPLGLSIEAGSSVCLAGPNGAGKSTLLLCLAGLLKYHGSVRVDGVEQRSPGRRGRDPSLLGLVLQDPDDQLFCTTVEEDVAFGPRNEGLAGGEVRARVEESLAMVGLEGFGSRVPHHLSVGEKKRAAMAAVLSCRPRVLALDEPWAGLDARACRALGRILDGFPGTVIIATQDLRHAVPVCGRLVVIDGGLLVADGPIRDIASDDELMEAHGLRFDSCESWRAAVVG